MASERILSSALAKLQAAESQLDGYADELAFFTDPKQVYSTEVILHFRGRAVDVENLKIMILGTLGSLGEQGERWSELIKQITFSERYLTEDVFPADDRPSLSGLIAAGNVVEDARLALSSTSSLIKPDAERQATLRPKARRGPEADLANHKKVAMIVQRFGDKWKSGDAPERICKEIDEEHVPIPKNWAKWKPKPRSWDRALENRRRPVIQALEYRCKWHAKNVGSLGGT
jgi:hypothetical protein